MKCFLTLVTVTASLVCFTACATSTHHARDWHRHGVKVVHGSDLELSTAQTPGMTRAAAINYATAGDDPGLQALATTVLHYVRTR